MRRLDRRDRRGPTAPASVGRDAGRSAGRSPEQSAGPGPACPAGHPAALDPDRPLGRDAGRSAGRSAEQSAGRSPEQSAGPGPARPAARGRNADGHRDLRLDDLRLDDLRLDDLRLDDLRLDAARAPRFAGHRPGEPTFRRLSAALFAAGVATFALLYSTQALLPALSRDFGASAGQAALTVSLCTAGLGVALLVAGPLSEAFGRTRLIHGSLLASSVLGLAGAAAPTLPALLVLRALEGLALAGLPAVATAYLREEVHPEAHARAIGLYIGGTGLGGMLGRLVAGGLTDLGGWRLGLAGTGVLGLGCAALAFALLPPSRNFLPAPARASHLLRLTGRALRDPVLLALDGVAMVLLGANVAVYNAVGFRLTSAPYHLSVGAAGLVYCVYPVGSASSTLAGRLVGRVGRGTVVALGAVLMAAGVLLTLAGDLAAIVAGLALMTAGFFAAHGVSSGWVVARAHQGSGGTGPAASLYLFSFYLGSSVFGGLAGTVWASGGWGAVVAMATALAAAGVLLAVGLSRTRGLEPTRAAG